MGETSPNTETLTARASQLVRRLLAIGENRLALLAVEVQEGGGRLLYAIVLALGMAVFGLMAGITLTAAIAVMLWAYSPVTVLLVLATLYGLVGVYLARRLIELQRDWQLFSATLEQLRKDRACFEAKSA